LPLALGAGGAGSCGRGGRGGVGHDDVDVVVEGRGHVAAGRHGHRGLACVRGGGRQGDDVMLVAAGCCFTGNGYYPYSSSLNFIFERIFFIVFTVQFFTLVHIYI
jgi:hypothetical protein